MNRLVLLAIGAVTMGMVSAAGATDKGEADRIRGIAARYATCVIAQSPRAARRYVIEEGKPPITGDCLVKATQGSGGEMRFPGQNYHYALAEALLTRDYRAGVPAALTTAPEQPHQAPVALDEAKLPANLKKAAAIRHVYSRRQSVWLMGVLGDCAARANPAGAFALSQTAVGSPPERAAFGVLKLAIGGCLPGDATVHFDPAALRGTIALNLYRLAYSVKAPGDA